MADRKATNKYYPPDWDPSKGSINKYRNSHPLRDRAKKLHLGILVIRFEMPYNIWCDGCKNHIGMGVRYNAEKTKVGMYYTTPVYKFKMKCHLCDNYIEMQTDPGNLDYIILSGASRQERRWDPTENGQVVPEDKNVSKQLASDPMFKLEHQKEDLGKIKELEPVMKNLEEFQQRFKDDYSLNADLRKKFRDKKKELKEQEAKDNMVKAKAALTIDLLPESDMDKKVAHLMRHEAPMSFDEKRKHDRKELMSKSILDAPCSSGSSTSSLKKKIMSSKTIKPKHTDALSKLKLGVKRKLGSSQGGTAKKLHGFEQLDDAEIPLDSTEENIQEGAKDSSERRIPEESAGDDKCRSGIMSTGLSSLTNYSDSEETSGNDS